MPGDVSDLPFCQGELRSPKMTDLAAGVGLAEVDGNTSAAGDPHLGLLISRVTV